MNPRSFSLAGLIGIVALFGIGFAALRSGSLLWTAIASTITLAILLTAVLGVIFLRGRDRAYWTGFAIFGWVYLILVNWSWVGDQFGHDLTGGIGDFAESLLPAPTVPLPAPAAAVAAFSGVPSAPMGVLAQRQVTIGNLVQIGRLMMSLTFGLLGGFLARVFAARADPQARAESPGAGVTG